MDNLERGVLDHIREKLARNLLGDDDATRGDEMRYVEIFQEVRIAGVGIGRIEENKVGDEVASALICVLRMDWSPLQSGERRDCSHD